jgi:hypothetical protein
LQKKVAWVIVKNEELGCKTYKKLGNLRPKKKPNKI